jgi:SAM-dependent methyltransferase
VPIEDERLSTSSSPPRWVTAEHHARYDFAAQFVNERIVVDCACGDGIGTEVFLAHGSHQVIAIDTSHEALQTTARRTSSRAAHCIRADGAMLPLPSHCAEVFISLETIEHAVDAERLLDEARRALKPEGILVCSTPNRFVTHPGATLAVRPISPFHKREYSIEEFRTLLLDRFQSVQLYGQNPQRRAQAQVLSLLAKTFPVRLVARCNQLMKARRFVRYNPSHCSVALIDPRLDYEYLVAVCRSPRSV